MAVSIAQVVRLGIPVVGQFQNSMVRFIAITDKSQSKTAFGIIAAAQQLHVQYVLIEIQRAFEIADTQHSMKQAHDFVPF